MAGLSKCEKRTHIIVIKNENFQSQIQEHMSHKDLHGSFTVLKDDLNILRFTILDIFQLLKCSPDEVICQT